VIESGTLDHVDDGSGLPAVGFNCRVLHVALQLNSTAGNPGPLMTANA
ncbi:hypothetical protein A2U01_0088691, partial [Trifolium medium]|nr:hypothetical protein [Trifolium medium]